MYECPVPDSMCSGSRKNVEPGARSARVHITVSDVRKCLAHYLISQGYKRGQNGQFDKDDGSPILVISRKPGMRLRKGKEGRFQAVNFRKTWKAW